MSESPVFSIYESTFAQSDKTDAILVVEGKKLHVNKTHLSFHSDYFKNIFNGKFKEKSMQEIPVKDVKFEDFVTLLSLVSPNPIEPKADDCEKLLKLADRFMLPGVKPYIGRVLMGSDISYFTKVLIGGQYGLDDLLYNGVISAKKDGWSLDGLVSCPDIKALPEMTQLKISLKIINLLL